MNRKRKYISEKCSKSVQAQRLALENLENTVTKLTFQIFAKLQKSAMAINVTKSTVLYIFS